MGRDCREWPLGATNAEVETLIEEYSEQGDAVIFTDGSVNRGTKSGWAFSVRVDGTVVKELNGATALTTSSMCMEIKAISEALRWIKDTSHQRAVIVTDSMSTLQKIEKGMLYADWSSTIRESSLEKVAWIFCPGHAGVAGNERADKLAGEARVGGRLTLDPPTVLAAVQENMRENREESSSHTLMRLKEKGIQRGEGRHSQLCGPIRRISNQMRMETVSRQTLGWILKRRGEQRWTCSDCSEPNTEDKV